MKSDALLPLLASVSFFAGPAVAHISPKVLIAMEPLEQAIHANTMNKDVILSGDLVGGYPTTLERYAKQIPMFRIATRRMAKELYLASKDFHGACGRLETNEDRQVYHQLMGPASKARAELEEFGKRPMEKLIKVPELYDTVLDRLGKEKGRDMLLRYCQRMKNMFLPDGEEKVAHANNEESKAAFEDGLWETKQIVERCEKRGIYPPHPVETVVPHAHETGVAH